eukprot:GHVS01061543.1.p1 GENE.GHVS01061543.1~~GHVS01061543.1.p1  ORF type:complete len:668 (+),score=94.11 GHVS01061543.1:303-2306(+)
MAVSSQTNVAGQEEVSERRDICVTKRDNYGYVNGNCHHGIDSRNIEQLLNRDRNPCSSFITSSCSSFCSDNNVFAETAASGKERPRCQHTRLFGLRFQYAMSLLLCFISALSSFNSSSSSLFVSAQLRVREPESLFDNYRNNKAFTDENANTLIGSTATFGTPTYGKEVLGRVYYVPDDSTHCNIDYCEEIKKQVTSFHGHSAEHKARLEDLKHTSDLSSLLKTILVVDRGTCTFVKKVYIAQKECGADAVIIVDKSVTNHDRVQIQHIIMADDVAFGFGEDIRVPSVLLSTEDGQLLKTAILAADNTSPVILEMEWTTPVQFPVEVNFFTDAAFTPANQFLHDFAKYALLLGGNMYFQPSYVLFDLAEKRNKHGYCLTEDDLSEMNRSVTDVLIGDTDFCGLQPMGSSSASMIGYNTSSSSTGDDILGREIALETLRQLCLNVVSAVRDVPVEHASYSEAYWQYQSQFWSSDEQIGCQFSFPKMAQPNGLADCSNNIITQLLTSQQMAELKDCMNGRLGYDILMESKRNRAWSRLAIQINGARLSGRMDPEVVVSAVCAGSRHPSSKAYRAIGCEELLAEAEEIAEPWIPLMGIQWRSIIIVVLFMFVVFAFCLYIYKKRLQESYASTVRDEVMMEVRAQLQEYHNLDEGDEGSGQYSRSPNRPLV